MGAFKLNLQVPKNIHGVEMGIDPKPDWSLDDLLTELNVIESKFSTSLVLRPSNPTDSTARKSSQARKRNEGQKPFVIRISDEDMDELDSDDERQTRDRSLVPASRFTCPDAYVSDDDWEEESRLPGQLQLLDKMGLVEGALLELTHEYQLGIKEEIRNHLSAWETQLQGEQEKSQNALVEVEKNTHARKEKDRKLDLHYQRKIAEGLDNHLTAIQRDHEHKSQKEEKKIRADAAAVEESRRKEKALQEEQLRQQKATAEEARREAARKAEEARKSNEEAERRAAKEEAEREAKENARKAAAASKEVAQVPNQSKNEQLPGNIVRAAESALKLEETRSQVYKELDGKNQALKSCSDEGFIYYKRKISRQVKSIRGLIDNVRTKVSELITIFNDPGCPQSLSASIFAEEVISKCEAPNGDSIFFACAHVIVLVSSQVPLVMDCLLAALHKACIYTVPKHLVYSKAAFETTEAYFKAIGFREEDGKCETMENYIKRLQSYMKLYGAMVQTETAGVRNTHGIEEGWRWLARFLNAVPPDRYPLFALEAFLSMAGFALHRRFKSQFLKVLSTISREFLAPLKQKEDTKVNTMMIIKNIETRKFLQEPEGRQLQGALLSRSEVPGNEQGHQQNHYSNNRYHY